MEPVQPRARRNSSNVVLGEMFSTRTEPSFRINSNGAAIDAAIAADAASLA